MFYDSWLHDDNHIDASRITGWFKNTFAFLTVIFLQVPILFCPTLLISVNNIVSSIFPENGI